MGLGLLSTATDVSAMTTSTPKNYLIYKITFGLCLVFALVYLYKYPHLVVVDKPFTVEPAPKVVSTLMTKSGRLMELREIFGGRGGIIFLWGDWCPVCVQNLEQLAMHKAWLDTHKIRVVTLSLSPASGESLNAPGGFPTYYDVEGKMAAALNPKQLPVILWVNTGGVVIGQTNTVIDWKHHDTKPMTEKILSLQ
jgi:hypothetical protein